MFDNFFFPENHALYEVMSKKMEDSERSQMTVQHGACTLHAG